MLRPRLHALRWLFLVFCLGALACDLGDAAALVGGGGKPAITIVSPLNGSVFLEGDEIAVQSSATDSQGITRIELSVDGAIVRSDPLPALQKKSDLVQTWKATHGAHAISVRAYNGSNTASDSAVIAVNVTPAIALVATPAPTLPSAPTATPLPVATSVPTLLTPSPTSCPGPPVIASFTASPIRITAGNSTVLSWGAVTNAVSAAIDHSIGGVPAPGSKSVRPSTTTTYNLTATGCGGVVSSQVTVTVDPALPSTTEVSSQTTIAAGANDYALVRCPSGSLVTGGGFAAPANIDVVIWDSEMVSDGWRAGAKNGTGAKIVLTAYAICLRNSSGSSTQVVKTFPVDATQSGLLGSVNCPSGSVATGGGFHMTDAVSLRIVSILAEGNTFSLDVDNLAGTAQSLTGFAVCLAGTSATTEKSVSAQALGSGSTGTASTSCPSDEIVTGGGYGMQFDKGFGVYASHKSGNGWEASATNTSAANLNFGPLATCARFPP